MRLIIDIPDESYNRFGYEYSEENLISKYTNDAILEAFCNGTPIPDNITNGKEVLIKYCLEHSGEEIYNLLKRIFDASTSWTDSRGFIIDWLEKGIKNEVD